VLVVDAANVVGSRPDGWWRDHGRAAQVLCTALTAGVRAGRVAAPVAVVLEGAARLGAEEGEDAGVRVVHAAGSGDDTIARVAADAVADGHVVTVVTADRELRERVRAVGCEVAGPRWLLDRVSPPS
jgi:hypothetical protein